MITALVYFINGLVMLFFVIKLHRSLKNKKNNPYLNYFLGTTGFYCAALLAYTVLLTLGVLYENSTLLFYSDFIGRILIFIGTAFALQIPLFKKIPKFKYRYLASFLLLFVASLIMIYNYFNPNIPTVDSLNIVYWNAPNIVAYGFGLIVMGVWLPTATIFLLESFKEKSVKAFFLGIGFFLGALSGILQDFGRNTLEYVIINLLLAIGFILIFFGLFKDE